MNNSNELQEDFWFIVYRKGDVRKLWKPQIEVVFILKGTGRLRFGDMKTGYTVQEGDIFVINSFEMHNFELDRNATALSFTISLRFVASMNPEILNYRINCRSFLHGENNQDTFDVLRRDLAKAFEVEYKNVSRPSTHFKSKTAAVLEDLSEYFLDRSKIYENKGSFDSITRIAKYVQAHYRENISLGTLAKENFLSKSYISRSFKKYFDISFTDYVMFLRVIYAARILCGKQTISEIALESGFPNVNAMIIAFKRFKGVTPSEYRKLIGEDRQKKTEKLKNDGVRADFTSLMKYIVKKEEAERPVGNIIEVSVDTAGRKQRISGHWKRIINAGYAKSLTDGTVQREVRYLQKKIGFEYIRIKGFVDDDMCLLRRDMNGDIVKNFGYVDEVLDFILSTGAKPMIEIGYMPELLAGKVTLHSMRNTHFGAPDDLEQWHILVKELAEHMITRYGKNRVRQWIFTPWIPPDFAELGICSLDEYEQIYYTSFRALKEVNPNLVIAGPGSTDAEYNLKWFLEMCRKRDCLPNVITFRSFGVGTEQEENGLNLIGNNESFSMAVNGDENLIWNTTQRIKNLLREEGLSDIPLVLEEWSNNVWQRDLCNDTCYKSAYLFKNILENNHHLNGMGYFTLNDRIEEVPPAANTFHGGFGLFTQNDIPKSACRAMELLGKMGNRLLQKGDGYYITQTDEAIQIFLYNYRHYDLLYRYRHIVNMDMTNRYNVFVSKESREFYIRFEHMETGKYDVKRYGITQEGGSSYDAWVRMGAPEPLEYEEIQRLRDESKPLYRRVTAEVGEDGGLDIKESLNLQEVCLLEIKNM